MEKYSFTKTWKSREDFPTHEYSEEQVRSDLQYLFDELLSFINDLATLVIGDHGADNIQVPVAQASQRLTDVLADIKSTLAKKYGSDSDVVVPIAKGGTGATTKADARTRLGITSGPDEPAASYGDVGDVYVQVPEGDAGWTQAVVYLKSGDQV